MPSSGVTTWPVTFAALAESAMRELGAIGMGDTPDSAEIDEALIRFNLMLRTWSTTANLYREALATITIAGGDGAATLPSDVRDVRTLRYIQSATNQRPLTQWNRDQYLSLPNRTQSGNPTMFYYSQQPEGVGDQLYVWPVPSADSEYELDYSRGAYVVTDPTQTLDLPEEWAETALYGLASRMASMFGATRLDPAAVSRCDSKASALFEAMLDSDRPDSYQFYYDSPVEAY